MTATCGVWIGHEDDEGSQRRCGRPAGHPHDGSTPTRGNHSPWSLPQDEQPESPPDRTRDFRHAGGGFAHWNARPAERKPQAMTVTQPDEGPPLLWEQLHALRLRAAALPTPGDVSVEQVEEAMIDMMQLGQMRAADTEGRYEMVPTHQLFRVLDDVLWWSSSLGYSIDMQTRDQGAKP